MPPSPLMVIAERLHQMLIATFTRSELTQLLAFRLEFRIDQKVPDGLSYDAVVYHVVMRALAEGWLLNLAREASRERPQVLTWTDLVRDMEADPTRLVPSLPQGVLVVSRVQEPPQHLRTCLVGYRQLRQNEPERIAQYDDLGQLVGQMLELPLEEYELLDSYHLSSAEEHRLVAILTLCRRPDARYLHWLSERVGVEIPVLGRLAAQALLAAARALPLGDDLDTVAEAVREALEWIPTAIPQTGRSHVLVQSIAVLADEVKILAEALEVVKRRTTGQP